MITKFDYPPRLNYNEVARHFNRYVKVRSNWNENESIWLVGFGLISLTWTLVADEVELQSLFEGVLVDVIFHRHSANNESWIN